MLLPERKRKTSSSHHPANPRTNKRFRVLDGKKELDGDAMASKRARKQEVFRPRSFMSGTAISTAVNYFTPWKDFHELATDITDGGRWLLITGPWQSGKSSLMFALAEEASNKGYNPVVMSLSRSMVSAANNVSQPEEVASDHFFDRLTERLVANSNGTLEKCSSSGVAGFMQLFQGEHGKEFVWFIDEASLLNDIRRTSIIQTFLSELRTLKQECVSRCSAGSYYLRSFVLVGTPKLRQLIGDLRIERVAEVGYVLSSPGFDPDDPLGNSISPLSMERYRALDALTPTDIELLLKEYRMEHDAWFFLDDAPAQDPSAEESDAAIVKLSKSIWALTSGHKGMVGCCCEYLANSSAITYTQWKRDVRLGHVSRYLFHSKCYSRVVSNVTEYSEVARQVVLQCIVTGTSVAVSDLSAVLRPLNDGVLIVEGTVTVQLASELLRAAFLEDCSFTHLEALPDITSFIQAIQATFTYMNFDRLARDEVLNANGQPSEYVWACEFLLALKFILEKGYKSCKHTVMVEAKRRDQNGQRRTRLDFLLKSAGSPPKGFQLQGAGAGSAGVAAINKRIKKSADYAILHSCEMNYVYLQYGNYGVDAKATIMEEASKFQSVECWFVQYLPEARKWNIERLVHQSGWISEQRDGVANFPALAFRKRRQIVL